MTDAEKELRSALTLYQLEFDRGNLVRTVQTHLPALLAELDRLRERVAQLEMQQDDDKEARNYD